MSEIYSGECLLGKECKELDISMECKYITPYPDNINISLANVTDRISQLNETIKTLEKYRDKMADCKMIKYKGQK